MKQKLEQNHIKKTEVDTCEVSKGSEKFASG